MYYKAGQAQGVGRQVAIKAGVPQEVPGYTLNIMYGSGMKLSFHLMPTLKAEKQTLSLLEELNQCLMLDSFFQEK